MRGAGTSLTRRHLSHSQPKCDSSIMGTRTHNERCRDCKANIRNLLAAVLGTVEVNYDLDLPSRLEDYKATPIYEVIGSVHAELEAYRGFSEFVKTKRLPRVDFLFRAGSLLLNLTSHSILRCREISHSAVTLLRTTMASRYIGGAHYVKSLTRKTMTRLTEMSKGHGMIRFGILRPSFGKPGGQSGCLHVTWRGASSI